jgi:uncharacterized protein
VTLPPAAAAAFALLSLALLAVGLPRSLPWSVWAWTVPFALSAVAALLGGVLLPAGAAAILVYGGACAGARRSTFPLAARAVSGVLVLAISVAFMLHVAPGFRNPLVMDRVVLGPGALPFTKYLNYDKAIVGLFLLGIWYRPVEPPHAWREVLRSFAPRFAAVVALVLLLSLGTGYVRWDPKASPSFPIWAWSTLLFTVVGEEAFFRSLVQTTLHRWLGGTGRAQLPSLALASVLFGVAHLAGGPLYVALATVAGLGYGWVFIRTGSIGAAILTHFGVNALHFLLFTYPALESATR